MVGSIFPLAVDNVRVEKRGARLLGPLSLDLNPSGVTIIIGPNGSGKTTLLRLMHGLERPRGGDVRWAVPDTVAQQRQAFVFQTPIILRRTVRENIAFPLLLQKVAKREAFEVADHWLARVGLAKAARLNATVLSGGEKQKLAIARSLVRQPELLFLDEPTTNLDGKSTREIEAILAAAVADGLHVIMTTHDMGQARRLADEVVFLYQGQVHERNTGERFFADQQTKEARAFIKGDIVE